MKAPVPWPLVAFPALLLGPNLRPTLVHRQLAFGFWRLEELDAPSITGRANLVVKLTREDVLEGREKSPDSCAVALRLRAMGFHPGSIMVGPATMDAGEHNWFTPRRMAGWIAIFDLHGEPCDGEIHTDDEEVERWALPDPELFLLGRCANLLCEECHGEGTHDALPSASRGGPG